MRREILHKRIGEKAHPSLTPLLNGEIGLEDLPSVCMIWKGRQTRENPRIKRFRSGPAFTPGLCHTMQRPFGMITVDKKTKVVHRYVYETVRGSLDDHKLANLCGNTLCVNPRHWKGPEVIEKQSFEDLPEPPEEEPWTEQEVEQLLDIYLVRYDTLDLNHPDIAPIPRPLLRTVLDHMGKNHLWPTSN